MITKSQTKELREILGFKHLSKIAKYLAEQKIYNRDGCPYSSLFISRVFNGGVANAKMEAGIFAAARNYPIEQAAEMERREEILRQAKKDQGNV
jgi:hypothetical protein